MKKIRVAFFAEILVQDFDGASRTMFQILDRIPKDRFEFMFFCGMPPDKDLESEVVELPTLKIPFNKTYRVVFPYFSKNKIKAKLDAFQPDVIHIATPSMLGNVAKSYALKESIPISTIYHTHFISYIKYYFRALPFLIPFFYKKSIRITHDFYKNVDQIYVPSKQIIEDLKTICKLKDVPLKLWQRGIDNQLFNPAKRDKKYIRNIVKNDYPTILFASRLVWEKNLQTLINLYKLTQQKSLKVNFVVAGDGVARRAIEAQMPNAHFVGMLDHEELSILYASSDIYFFPSDTESFGNVVIEAMASGLPCVVANGGGPKGFIKNGVNGFLCKTNDTEQYLNKIQRLLFDTKLRKQIVKAGLDFTNSLSWEGLVDTYWEDLNALVEKNNIRIIPIASYA